MPGLVGPAAIAELAKGPLPVAVMVWPGAPSVAELAAAGAVRARMIRSVARSRPVTLGGATGNLIPQGVLEYRRAQLALAEEGKLAAVLQVEESGQAVAVDAFGAGGTQQQTVDIGEPGAVLPEHGPARTSHLPRCPAAPMSAGLFIRTNGGSRPLPHSAPHGR